MIDVEVTTEKTEIFFTSVRNTAALGIQVKNVSGSALNSFQVNGRIHSEADWVAVAKSSEDFISPLFTGLIAFCSGDPTTLAVGAGVIIGFDRLFALAELQILASSQGKSTLNILDYRE